MCVCVWKYTSYQSMGHIINLQEKKILEIQIVYSFFLFVCSSFDHRFFFFFCCCIRDISIDMINQSINQINVQIRMIFIHSINLLSLLLSHFEREREKNLLISIQINIDFNCDRRHVFFLVLIADLMMMMISLLEEKSIIFFLISSD